MAESLTVVGGTVAALVAALTAARNGRRVTLYVDPARIGGSFGGVVTGGWRFDLGPRLFELDYEGGHRRPIAAFDPAQDGHRPYIDAVAALIRDVMHGALRPAPVPEMWCAGRRTRCVLMTVDLADLPAALPEPDRILIRDQAARILHGPATSLDEDATLEQVSLARHGPRLHALLTEVVCAKQLSSWRDVLASERRKLWAALFEPRTVFEAFAGRPIGFSPHRPFTTTTAGQAHPFVRRLFAAVQAAPGMHVVPAGPLTGIGGGPAPVLRFGALEVPGTDCLLGVPADQAFRAAGLHWVPERAEASVLWADVAERDVLHVPSALMMCDPDTPVLRVSAAGRAGSRQAFAVEFGAAQPCARAATEALRLTGLVAERAEIRVLHRVSGPGQVAPTLANRLEFERARSVLAPLRLTMLAGARRFGFDGMNDQIADGLHHGAA